MGWIIFILGTIGWHLGIYGMFKKAGITPWKAFVPFYNTWCIVEVCNIPKFWFWLQLIPIAGQFITIWIVIIFVMHFGRFNVANHTAAVFLPFVYLPYLGYSKEVRWGGTEVVRLYQKSPSREWVDAAVFAIVAATIIRTFIFEAYTIPTESMEKTLLINDFLFVNKMSYGPRLPQTPISFPFVHNTLPAMPTTPSYLKWIQVPYTRLPGYTDIKRNDVVVFNFPAGDTIINLEGFGSAVPYYDMLRERYNGNRDALMADYVGHILVHPMDKTDNYIKRCVAIYGDVLQVKAGVLYINNQPAFVPPGSQIDYNVPINGKPVTAEFLNDQLDINTSAGLGDIMPDSGCVIINMTPEEKVKVEKLVGGTCKPALYTQENTFPYSNLSANWSRDFFGPITIPQKDVAITLTADNIELYRRLITVYEHNTLEDNGGKFIINGKETNTYTPIYNYYWMMGDNRHRSQDSRFWGFVPETHVVGKASLIWFSWNNGPRWDRLFSSIK
ncbi:signal peptidase I [Limnovirga soli]|uniref:Signal peptidase I n=1 Tax=Limnovirga soli TaxID=2656915 RepID=A0A8J8FDS0_9BACT|nr:signal peptidase I [Limnovirga soli]NNV55647.1 signal peptidase I [Limnovirga soli]